MLDRVRGKLTIYCPYMDDFFSHTSVILTLGQDEGQSLWEEGNDAQ